MFSNYLNPSLFNIKSVNMDTRVVCLLYTNKVPKQKLNNLKSGNTRSHLTLKKSNNPITELQKEML